MLTKLDRIRIKNLLDVLQKTEDAAERLGKSEDQYLKDVSRNLIEIIEDRSMELGMMLAEDDDGKPI